MNVAVCHGNYLSNEILAPTVEIRNSVSPRADTPPADAPPPKKKLEKSDRTNKTA